MHVIIIACDYLGNMKVEAYDIPEICVILNQTWQHFEATSTFSYRILTHRFSP